MPMPFVLLQAGPTSKNRAVFTRRYCTGILFREIDVTFDLRRLERVFLVAIVFVKR